jgi:large subunit ribosomal protein L15
MPLQRRLPKVGFTSRVGRVSAEIRLHELAKVDAKVIDIIALKEANLIAKNIENVKVMLSGVIEKAVTLKGIKVSKGAKDAIEIAGGKIED